MIHNFFRTKKQNSEQQENAKMRLSEVTGAEANKELKPLDQTKELLKNQSKDKRLFKYAQYYQKQDFHDRYFLLAMILCVLAYALSFLSSYLSYPFLVDFLADDFQDMNLLIAAILGIFLVVEFAKHMGMAFSFKSWYTYQKMPITGIPITLLAVAASIYMCLNGVSTSSEQDYQANLPTIDEITTQYDGQIERLVMKNDAIFEKHNYRGKINESSDAGKAHGANEKLISTLEEKQMVERETKFNQALAKYDATTTQKSSFRNYIGWIVESMIVLCGCFFLYYKFHSHSEYLEIISQKYDHVFGSRLEQLDNVPQPTTEGAYVTAYSQNTIGFKAPENVPNDMPKYSDASPPKEVITPTNDLVATPSITSELTDKVISFHQVSERLRTYQGFKKSGKRNKETVKARIAFFENLLDEMTAQEKTFIYEPVFVKADWL